MRQQWSTVSELKATVRRRWADGSLLRALAGATEFCPIDVPLRGPKPSEIGDNLLAAKDWITAIEAGAAAGRHYEIEFTTIGGRHFGRNRVPSRIRMARPEQAAAFIGVQREVQRFNEVIELTKVNAPVRDWALAHPHRALELADEVPRLIAAATWLDAHRGSGHYLRQISAPGVDTKFAERHRPELAQILGTSRNAATFLHDLGLQAKPETVRIRVAPGLGLPAPLSDLTVRVDDLRELSIAPSSAIIVENEITFLSLDVPDGGIVIWGKGYEVDRIGRLSWLQDIPVTYWGDIDTHGFAILDMLRAWLDHAESVLMDRATLMSHRDRWVREAKPTAASLQRLRPAERELYTDLVTDRLGPHVRLEQERVDWTAALTALRAAGHACGPGSTTRASGSAERPNL